MAIGSGFDLVLDTRLDDTHRLGRRSKVGLINDLTAGLHSSLHQAWLQAYIGLGFKLTAGLGIASLQLGSGSGLG